MGFIDSFHTVQASLRITNIVRKFKLDCRNEHHDARQSFIQNIHDVQYTVQIASRDFLIERILSDLPDLDLTSLTHLGTDGTLHGRMVECLPWDLVKAYCGNSQFVTCELAGSKQVRDMERNGHQIRGIRYTFIQL